MGNSSGKHNKKSNIINTNNEETSTLLNTPSFLKSQPLISQGKTKKELRTNKHINNKMKKDNDEQMKIDNDEQMKKDNDERIKKVMMENELSANKIYDTLYKSKKKWDSSDNLLDDDIKSQIVDMLCAHFDNSLLNLDSHKKFKSIINGANLSTLYNINKDIIDYGSKHLVLYTGNSSVKDIKELSIIYTICSLMNIRFIPLSVISTQYGLRHDIMISMISSKN